MAVFEYKGLDRNGKAVSGIIDADSPKVARYRLRRQGLFPTEVKAQARGGGAARGKGLNVEVDFAKYFQFISGRDISILTRQMATMLGASVPMAETLKALVDQSEKSKLKVIVSEVKEKVNEGSTLADAMKVHPRVFDELYVHMVRAGEKAGALSLVLERLAEFNEARVKLRGKIIAALVYPILMMIVGTLILLALFVGVVPRMRTMFAGLDDDGLPLLSQIVFGFGDVLLSGWSCVAVFLLIVAGIGFRFWKRSERGLRQWDWFKLKIPLFGKVALLIAVARFCRTLATLLTSGVPILTALAIVKDVVGNTIVADAIDKASKNIQEGQSIAVPLRDSRLFPPMVTHMIAIGERTGELENMLLTVADAYESQVEVTIDAVTSLLAPLMIIVLGVVVLFVALALLLPAMQLSQRFI